MIFKAFGAVKCKTPKCEVPILREYLGVYDPERITTPECEEEVFTERCPWCEQEHRYELEDAIVVLVCEAPPQPPK